MQKEKPKVMFYYMDDSGSKKPDKTPKNNTDPDWFALGGLLILDENKEKLKNDIISFSESWNLTTPLHSVDLRHSSRGFSWLSEIEKAERNRFYQELHEIISNNAFTIHGCVIDKKGYVERYYEQYGEERWKLCKTAFSIAVERAAKIAHDRGAILKVYVEKSNRKDDNRLKQYFHEMKKGKGMPFNPATSSKYQPYSQEDLERTLDEIDFKTKENHIMQIADIVLYPICKGPYNPDYFPYKKLCQEKRINSDQNDAKSIKYSCFDGFEQFNTKETPGGLLGQPS